MKKVLIVADVSNLYYSIKKHYGKRKLDFKAFLKASLKFAGDDAELYRAIAYGADMDGQASAFIHKLHKFGYEIKYKEPIVYQSPIPGRETRKADWDVGMAMDVVKILDSVDIVIFATADGDMSTVLDYVIHKGKIARVFACGISGLLKDSCNFWLEIGPELLEKPNDTDRQAPVESAGSSA